MAVAIGDRRRYGIVDIVLRLSLQSVARADYDAREIPAIFDELGSSGEAALDRAISGMPADIRIRPGKAAGSWGRSSLGTAVALDV